MRNTKFNLIVSNVFCLTKMLMILNIVSIVFFRLGQRRNSLVREFWTGHLNSSIPQISVVHQEYSSHIQKEAFIDNECILSIASLDWLDFYNTITYSFFPLFSWKKITAHWDGKVNEEIIEISIKVNRYLCVSVLYYIVYIWLGAGMGVCYFKWTQTLNFRCFVAHCYSELEMHLTSPCSLSLIQLWKQANRQLMFHIKADKSLWPMCRGNVCWRLYPFSGVCKQCFGDNRNHSKIVKIASFNTSHIVVVQKETCRLVVEKF